MNTNIRITSGPAIEKPGDLAALLTNLAPNDVNSKAFFFRFVLLSGKKR